MSNTLNIPIVISLVDLLCFCDASFSCREGKSVYGMAIYFDNYLVVAGAAKENGCSTETSAYGIVIYFDNYLIVKGAAKEKKCFSENKSKVCAIIYALRRDRELGYKNINILLDAQDVINDINGAEDWAKKILI